MKLHINIKSITYINTNNTKIKCIIRWINPLTGNIQHSVGVSKCNPIDKFDTTKGHRIAESRAKINMWEKYIESVKQTQIETRRRHVNFILHELNHLDNLINNTKTN